MKRLLIEGTDANANLVVTAKAIRVVLQGWVEQNFIQLRENRLGPNYFLQFSF